MSLSCLRLCHLVVFATWACTTSFVIAAEPRDVRDSSYSLSQAEAYLASIRTADYTFSCSYYEQPIRIRLDGVMIRCDARIPGRNGKGELVQSDSSDAFNGQLFQHQDHLSRTLLTSRTRSDSTTQTSGPCWTPLECIFRWCRAKDMPEFSWQGLRDPATWDVMRKMANPECERVTLDINGESVECDVITFSHSSQTTSKVYLARAKGFLPVRDEVYNSSSGMSGPVFKMDVEKFVPVGELNSRVWFPTAISSNTLWLPPGIAAKHGEHASYTIDANTVRLNEDIDDKVFTLDREGMDSVYLDGNEVYRSEKDKSVAFDEALPELLPANPSGRNWWLPVLISANVVAVLAILVVVKMRRS